MERVVLSQGLTHVGQFANEHRHSDNVAVVWCGQGMHIGIAAKGHCSLITSIDMTTEGVVCANFVETTMAGRTWSCHA